MVEDTEYQVINVSGVGDCFYDAMQIALAYVQIYETSQRLKEKIMDRMKDLHGRGVQWFANLYAVQVDHDKRTGRPMNFRQYIRQMERRREWASMLEVKICSELYKAEIRTNRRGTDYFNNNLADIGNLCQHVVQPNCTVHLCQLNASDFEETDNLNHYVFLRPLDRYLQIHKIPDKVEALARVQSLYQVALTDFKQHLDEQVQKIDAATVPQKPATYSGSKRKVPSGKSIGSKRGATGGKTAKSREPVIDDATLQKITGVRSKKRKAANGNRPPTYYDFSTKKRKRKGVRNHRDKETDAERERRLALQKSYAATPRSNETESQKALRLEAKRAATASQIARETESQRAARLEAMRAVTASQIARETESQKALRLSAQRALTASQIASETESQRAVRLEAKKVLSASQVARESDSETDARLSRIGRNTSMRIRAESPEGKRERQRLMKKKMNELRKDRKRKVKTYRRFCEPPPSVKKRKLKIDQTLDLGEMNHNCKYCGAQMWIGERVQASSKKKP